MSIFASTPARSLDQAPYVWPEWARTFPDGLARNELRSMFSTGDGIDLIYSPRPEFEQPRAHDANPILVEFRTIAREDWKDDPEGLLPEYADAWVDLIDSDPDMAAPINWGRLAGTVTPEQIAHARRVLARLAGVAS